MPPPPDTTIRQDQLDALIGLYAEGRLQEALAQGLALARQHPDVPLLMCLLGAFFTGLGRVEEAVASYQRALALKPDYAEAHNDLGYALDQIGRHEEAVASYQRALALRPDNPSTHANLGIALCHLGRHEQAVASFRRALTLGPGFAEAHLDLGMALGHLGRYEEAIVSYRQSIVIRSDVAEAHNELGIALSNLGRHEEAAASFKRAFELDRKFIAARGAWLHQSACVCDWDRLEDELHGDLSSLEYGPGTKEVTPPFNLLALIDDAGFHRRTAEAYAAAWYPPDPALGPPRVRQYAERIRIGYFSADFHDHATMHLMAELFERHDRSGFEIHAFSFGPDRRDEMRSRLLNGVEVFHDVRSASNAEIAGLSRSHGIDIAVDLKGYTANGRTGIFTYRAAPIQVGYLGYPGTMGAAFMDYIVADPVLIPPAYQRFYSEKVAYLPGCYQVNDGRRGISGKAMQRADFGLPDQAFVFCCFNNSFKIMPDVFDIWMRLLGEIDGSVLWLLKSNEAAERNLRKAAVKRGIDPDRLLFAARMPVPEHLARHRLADLFLDTFNYNAHTTASDALRAGLPLLTKIGESFASRVAGSLLTAVDLPEMITATAQEYEATALRLASDPHELQRVKVKLGHTLKTTALFDAALFARHIEAAYTQMIGRLREGLAPEHFHVERLK